MTSTATEGSSETSRVNESIEREDLGQEVGTPCRPSFTPRKSSSRLFSEGGGGVIRFAVFSWAEGFQERIED